MAALNPTEAEVLVISGSIKRCVFGGSVTQGMALYKDTSDNNHFKPADADVEASAVVEGIALCAGEDGQEGTYLANGGVIDLGVALTVGTFYYLGLGAGEIGPLGDLSSGDYITLLGYALTADNLQLHIINTGLTVP